MVYIFFAGTVLHCSHVIKFWVPLYSIIVLPVYLQVLKVLFNSTVSTADDIMLNGRMKINDKLERMWEESVMA